MPLIRGRLLIFLVIGVLPAGADEPWRVEDVRAGMKGFGLTVVQGVKPERFEAEILGVLRDVHPGRDMILARFAGLGLEKSGVMAGMSGSPVYVDGRLLGAVAYTWEFGLEPIGAVTPYCQMKEFAERPAVAAAKPASTVVSVDAYRGQWKPIATPVAVSGLSDSALERFTREMIPWRLVPVQSGSANQDIQAQFAEEPIVPGSAIAVGLMTGDVSMTAIGTVTAVEGTTIHAFGHPFLELGRCRLPMMSAYVHAVLPLQNRSIKMGSALSVRGQVTSDVSTGIAGSSGAVPSLIQLLIHTSGDHLAQSRDFECRVAHVPAILPSLVATTTASCLEGDGKPPIELSAKLRFVVTCAGLAPFAFEDLYAGEKYQGPAGLVSAVAPLSETLKLLVSNPFRSAEVSSIEVWADVEGDRRSAAITHASPGRPTYHAGQTAEILVQLQPFRPPGESTASIERKLRIDLPSTLPAGEYTVQVAGGAEDLDRQSAWQARWNRPRDLEESLAALRQKLDARRTHLVARLDTKESELDVAGRALADLPLGVADILSSNPSRETRVAPVTLVAREETPWSLEGTKSVTLTVVVRRGLSLIAGPQPPETP